MLLDNIKEENSKVLILGINKVSINLIKYLADSGVNVIVGDTDEGCIQEYCAEFSGNNLVSFVDINKIDLDVAQYCVLCKDILLEKDELNILLTRLDNIKEKVYLDIEFISMLFSQNKYIGIIGESYNIITNSIISHIFENIDNNSIPLSCNYLDIVKNITFNNTIFYEALQDCKIQYLQQMSFDVLVIFDIDSLKNEDIQNYILTNQNKDSVIIINVDNENLKDIYDNIGDVNCKIIPISTNKMLNDGISYINGSVYNYFENNNKSHDITLNDDFVGNINNISLLCSYIIINYCNIEPNAVIESVKSVKTVPNYLECMEKIENVQFINNIGADTEKLFYEPFEIYDNVYSIFIANDKQSDLSYIQNCIKKTKNIIIIDICGLLNVNNISNKINIVKYSNLKDAFNYIIKEIDFNDKETNTTVLLSSLMSDKMNCIYYKDYVKEFKELIKGLNKC